MLKEDFYKIVNIESSDDSQSSDDLKFSAVIELSPSHKIYLGHFPGNPVTPGACLVQIIKEMTETYLRQKLILRQATGIKFLLPIKPDINPFIKIETKIKSTDENVYSADSIIYQGDDVCVKFKGKFS